MKALMAGATATRLKWARRMRSPDWRGLRRPRRRLRGPEGQSDRGGREQERPREAQTGSAREPAVVLVVDDDPAVRHMTARFLSAEGIEVLEAGSGAEALELCASHAVAVVVTDLIMPRMNGVELAQQLTARWPETRLLFVTAYPKPEYSPLPGRLMVKPYPIGDFVAAVRELAAGYRPPRGA
jgi:CheY-like chemotaxis protein